MFKKVVTAFAVLSSLSSFANSANLWASIPFIRGADLCQYKQAFSKERSEYMEEMTDLAVDLMRSGAKGKEALAMLVTFDQMYDKNVRLAKSGKYLDVTLENTLKAYLDQYYRNLNIRNKNVNFRHLNDIRYILNSASNGQRAGYLPEGSYNYLDYIAYGTYAYAPNCKGGIQVTLHLVGEDGMTKSYIGQGKPNIVMSQIATKLFEDFQKPNYPIDFTYNRQRLRVLGTYSGYIGKDRRLSSAEDECRELGGRLTKERELIFLSKHGFWNGGVDMGRSGYWFIDGHGSYQAYSEEYRKSTPVSWANGKELKYMCVSN